MPIRRAVVLAVVLIALLGGSPAPAATIRLKTGRELQVEIVSETTEGVQVRMAGGTMWIPRRQIDEIVRAGAPESAPESTPKRPRPDPTVRKPEGVGIFEALGSGRIRLEARGESIATVLVRVEVLRPDEREVVIPPGALLVPRTRPGVAAAASLVVTAPVAFRAVDGPVTLRVPVASTRREGRVPGAEDRLDLRKDGASNSLRRLAPTLHRGSTPMRQAAVWIVTDDATFEDLGKLSVATKDESTGRVSHRPAIGPAMAASAMWLVDDCGLRLSARRIWKSRAILVSVIVPDTNRPADRNLARWARDALSEFGSDVPAIIVGILEAPVEDAAVHEACRVAAERRIREALPALRKLAGGTSLPLALRAAATHAIALLTGDRATPDASPAGTLAEVLAHLGGKDAATRRRALLTLIEVSDRVSDSPRRRQIGTALVAEIAPPADRLTDEFVRAEERYRDAIDPTAIVDATRSPDRRVRIVAIRLLLHFRSEAATARVIHLLRDPDPELCLAALHAVGDHPEGWTAIVHLLRHDVPAVRQQAAAALAAVTPGTEEIAALARCLRDEDEDVHAVAASTLDSPCYIASRRAVPDLTDRLRTDPSVAVRLLSAHALAGILSQAPVPLLEEALGKARSDRERQVLAACLSRAKAKTR